MGLAPADSYLHGWIYNKNQNLASQPKPGLATGRFQSGPVPQWDRDPVGRVSLLPGMGPGTQAGFRRPEGAARGAR